MSNTDYTAPAVYVGTYHKYNCGSIAGQWMHLEDFDNKEEFLEACQELHKDEMDPELMFQDWEYIPKSMVGESWVSEGLWDFILYDADYSAKQAFIEWYGEWNADVFEESYQGEYDSELAFAEQLVDDLGYLEQMPEQLQFYFDYEKFSRDLFINDYWFEDGHVFNRNI